MCYTNVGSRICKTCDFVVGEHIVGYSTCPIRCGKYVNKPSDEKILDECGVCRQAREARASAAQRLNQVFGR